MSRVEHFVNDVSIHQAIMDNKVHILTTEVVMVQQVVHTVDILIPMDRVQCMGQIMAMVIHRINIINTDKWDTIATVIIAFHFFLFSC